MGTKNNDSCLTKAADDEPIFVLRAQDLSAPELVETWIARNPQLTYAKKQEAFELAHRMRMWHTRKLAD